MRVWNKESTIYWNYQSIVAIIDQFKPHHAPQMVLLDVFAALPQTAQSRALPIEQLRLRLDEHAPSPMTLRCPEGGPLFLFAVDFHRVPRLVCERMGFAYAHLRYLEARDADYQAIHIINVRGLQWLKVFIQLWAQ